ncbi:MAG: glycosyltransferase family 4 protein [Paracoccaceae bacterium]
MTAQKPSLAVVVKGWPRLSETFIAQELVALEESGQNFDIWSLRRPTDKKTHPLHARLEARVFYLPEYLRDEPARVLKALWWAVRQRGFLRAFTTFLRDLNRDRTRNRIRRFGQACVLGREGADSLQGLYAHFLHTPSSVTRYAAILRALPWSFSAHAKDIWTSPDWDLREKLSPGHNGAHFGATCTQFGAEHLRSLSSGTDIDLVYHGLDLSRFPDPPERAQRSSDAPLTLLSVGRLVEKKGFDRLIAAFGLLPETLNWRWVHIGGGALAQDMKALAEETGVADRIEWLGACDQPQVIDAMRDADLFVLPSRIADDGDRDGLPNVLMEAASQTLPILSTPVSAIPEFIDDGVHGLLRSDTPADIAAGIMQIANDPTLGPTLAEQALQRLRTHFMMHPGIAHLDKRLNAMTKETAE